jgi:sugar phosphate isomerase/epimerase
MRLGIALDTSISDDPTAIAAAYAAGGYSAAVCPPVRLDQPERIRAIQEAFARHNVALAELGVWNNLLEPSPARRAANLEANIQALALAEAVGVRCCVNIAGSFNPDRWDGPHPKNLSAEAFALTVENVRRILDAVRPRRTVYSLETMPWVLPDSPASYRQLLEAIDRPMFGVHLDPVNMINCPARYYENAAFLRACFEQLGPWIVSCHGKDIRLRDHLTIHLDEVRPGLGALDYGAYLQALSRLPLDVPLIIEHLPQAEYPLASAYVRSVAQAHGLHFIAPTP